MGTRADFYLGIVENDMKWVGSIAWDGNPGAMEIPFLDATTSEAFLAEVEQMRNTLDDFTTPEEGWPWPWDDSGLTDYAYAFDPKTKRVYASGMGYWFDPVKALKLLQTSEEEDQGLDEEKAKVDIPFFLPNMKELRKEVAKGLKSGIFLISSDENGLRVE